MQNCGVCVVLPEPVSPTSTRLWFPASASMNCCLYSVTGSRFRPSRICLYRAENGLPVSGFVSADAAAPPH